MDERRKEGYITGLGCLVICLLLLVFAVNNAWNMSGQILWASTLVFGVLGSASLWKPDSIGAIVSQFLKNLDKRSEEGSSDSHNKQIQKKSSGIQVMSHDQSKVKIIVHSGEKENAKNLPENTERDIARQVISYLEDRRVLYVPSEMEIPSHCVQSVLQIREFLTSKIGETPEKTELSNSLRAMRASCRKFLDATSDPRGEIIRFGSQTGHWASWKFNGAIGELRGVFGIHIAKIAGAYGINVEKELASIMPLEDTD